MIVHNQVEQVEKRQSGAAVDLQKPPEPLAILAAQGGRLDPAHQPKKQANGILCTLIPVRPTMSARAQRSKSIGSTFSSIRVIVCSPGVSAASRGRAATGKLARLPT